MSRALPDRPEAAGAPVPAGRGAARPAGRARRAVRIAAWLGAAALALVALPACGPGPDAPAPRAAAAPAEALPRARVRVGMHLVDAEIAETFESRARGLSGRRRLPEGHGMLFVYPRADRYGFWMPDMHFDLDLVWIRGDRIAEITADVPHDPPGGELPIYRPSVPVDRVLEVPAGTAARLGWSPGDPVAVERLPDP